ncbi:MAG TPA: deoxyribonuclease IV [Tepidisphaeraceae bacterium]|jgi:deoxyribonuclease-4|nr:deoxyribonuclease IV [Tepidisphaeraceae bacterium]
MFGSHLSIAGGMHLAILKAQELGMDTVQVFTKNQQQWKSKPLETSAIAEWKNHLGNAKFKQTVSHDSYLINLASPDDKLWQASIALFIEELTRCDQLGIPWLVAHPGAHVGSGEEKGLTRIASALDRIHKDLPDSTTITCLEITAGQGTCLGCKLEHLAEIIDQSKHPERLAVCLDTAHLFAAGYDFRGKKYAALVKDIEKTVGLDRIKVLHLNDSKKELGSRVDRHDHIGRGHIGLEGFEGWMKDKRWHKVPKILETPKDGTDEKGRDWDLANLEALRSLMG